jgi:hypothetical protein
VNRDAASQRARLIELLAPDAIEAGIGVLVEIACVRAALPEIADAGTMPRVGRCPDVVVATEIEKFLECLEAVGSTAGVAALSADNVHYVK